MLEANDKKLIENIQAGETGAEIELFKKYSTQIARMVRFKLGPENTDWRDVAGDVQMVLLISLRQGKFDVHRGASLGSYIYTRQEESKRGMTVEPTYNNSIYFIRFFCDLWYDSIIRHFYKN